MMGQMIKYSGRTQELVDLIIQHPFLFLRSNSIFNQALTLSKVNLQISEQSSEELHKRVSTFVDEFLIYYRQRYYGQDISSELFSNSAEEEDKDDFDEEEEEEENTMFDDWDRRQCQSFLASFIPTVRSRKIHYNKEVLKLICDEHEDICNANR